MFGEVVRTHRRRLGWTQEDLAEHSGLTVRTIGKLEGGRIAAPRPATVRLLADAFGLDGADRDQFQAAALTAEPAPALHVPAQLPPNVSAFTGREAEVGDLDGLL